MQKLLLRKINKNIKVACIKRYIATREILMPGKDYIFHCHLPKNVCIIHYNELSYSNLMMIPKLDNHHTKGHLKKYFVLEFRELVSMKYE